MSTTQKSNPPVRSRGRPRAFDLEEALGKAQGLFHARGYDAVSVADLTEALGINPPSFYAAFGSKADLYSQALERYVRLEGLNFATLIAPDKPLAEGLAAVLHAAAANYSANPQAPGCLVIEGARDTVDPAAGNNARAMWHKGRDELHRVIARRDPDRAEALTDYMIAVMAGLSSGARDGLSHERLHAIAQMASAQLPMALTTGS
ncbi:MAG: TetR/AcrR family transcriptional regulator [Dongiaceae bacterium]